MERKERTELTEKVIRDLLKKLGVEHLFGDDLNKIIDFRAALTHETDRGCALMAAAYLHFRVDELIKALLVNDHALLNSLFNSTGPLGSFSSRIDMAYSLALISEDTKKDLHLLRKIRNEFAHNPIEISFKTDSISNRCRLLKYAGNCDGFDSREMFCRAMMGIDGVINLKVQETKNLDPLPNEDHNLRKDFFQKMQSLALTIKTDT